MMENIIDRVNDLIKLETERIESINSDSRYAKEETRETHLTRHRAKLRAYRTVKRIIDEELGGYYLYIEDLLDL